ncbi:alpha/beta-hydrolase [Pseudovirgaria hyperparasitica]|uniref:Alpha/beta-hydrolase n=1 Tax=Pseudovirgaria hyperparasitica TaxID=470096 RepID=A0A6A6VS04_9PEZI|nr:alpha/beta-hydrolase [Pseudovirgaria hyperparasitica]KAF2753372.1 alpha/beta-hydrolase [Pseudovirgaria hyperparasitica]
MTAKPTIIFVPGAWHLASGYDAVIAELKDAEYDAVKVELPSIGVEPGLQTWEKDVESVRSAISKTVEAGKDAVLVAHSYGSMPANEAVKGFEKTARQEQGKSGGIISYVYCTAFVLPEGLSLIDALGGNDLPWWKKSQNDTIVEPIDPATIFYNDLNAEAQKNWISKLKTFSYRMFYHKSTYAAWRHLPSWYIYCTLDNAIPHPVQQSMVQGTGVNFRSVTLEASHSPFLSKPKETAYAIRNAAGENV